MSTPRKNDSSGTPIQSPRQLPNTSTDLFSGILNLHEQSTSSNVSQANTYALQQNLTQRYFAIHQPTQPVQQHTRAQLQNSVQQQHAARNPTIQQVRQQQQQPLTPQRQQSQQSQDQTQQISSNSTQQPQQIQSSRRTMATSISVKAPEPEKCYGDSSKLEVWLYSVQLYFGAIGWATHSATHATHCASFMALLLRGPALQWHLRQSLTPSGAPNTFATLRDALRKHFGLLDTERRARDSLHQVKQTSTVADYIRKFEQVVMYLPNATSDELLHAFTYGLKDQIRAHFLLSQPSDLSSAQTAALTIDERSKPNYSFVAHAHKLPHSNFTHHEIVPMELGQIHKHKQNWQRSKGKGTYNSYSKGKQSQGYNIQRYNNAKQASSSHQGKDFYRPPPLPCKHCGGKYWNYECREHQRSTNKQLNALPYAPAASDHSDGNQQPLT